MIIGDTRVSCYSHLAESRVWVVKKILTDKIAPNCRDIRSGKRLVGAKRLLEAEIPLVGVRQF